MTELFSFQGPLRSDAFALRQVPLGKLSSHLVADEKGQFVALKLKFFKNLVILLILILIVGRDTP